MGFFDNLFGKSKHSAPAPACDPMTVYAPAEGEVIPLDQFPDEMFSQEVLGPGCGILPSGKLVTAPFNGTVTQVVDTLHAVGLLSSDGVEVLIHVGVDTVEMGGKGFKYHIKKDQRIHLGDPLITFDRKVIKEAGHSDAIAVVVTNSDEYSVVDLKAEGSIAPGGLMLKVQK